MDCLVFVFCGKQSLVVLFICDPIFSVTTELNIYNIAVRLCF